MSDLAVTRAYHFSAAHRLANPALSDAENARVYGQCFRQHGHNYGLEVTVAGSLDPATGMSVDLGVVDAAVKATVLDRVDHYDLSATVPALAGVITTGENLARVFYQWIEAALPPGVLRRVTLVETANNVFEYSGETHADEVVPR
ncbi:MAG TPA: 6-carboxytetrahydropterin synthase [Methylomirabilota bacterium]|nr:6-carboxytetrahydropterin synthase [Methylomirabilota bacterium]